MSASWVAGSVRARALARRRLGAGAARTLAALPSLPEALIALGSTPYRRGVRPGQTLAEAQHGIADTLLWHVRVLAGWLPPRGAELLRVLAGGFEIANVDELLRRLDGLPAEVEFRLGTLASSWSRLSGATSRSELRQRLATSVWGDPGDESSRSIQLSMRLTWAGRIAAALGQAQGWAAGAAALLVARERFAADTAPHIAALAPARPLLGSVALDAMSLPELAQRLPASARWALDGIDRPEQLWRAEFRWWSQVERDGFGLLSRSGFTELPVLGALAVLGSDAWRTRAALELAARGGRAVEVLDALA
jgi:hypothetical protein